MKKILSVLIVFILLLSSVSAVSADSLSSVFNSIMFQFDSEEELEALTGGVNYYIYSEEKGVDSETGCMSIPVASEQRSDGLGFEADIMDVNREYKISFWVKSASTASVTAYPVVILSPSDFVVTDAGSKDYTVGQTVSDTQTWQGLASNKVITTNTWKKFEAKIDFDTFTAGSNSVVDITSYTAGRIVIRGSGAFYVDNLTIEPYYEYSSVYSTETPSNEVLGDEIFNPDKRFFTNKYHSSTTNHTHNAVLSSGTNGDGRIIINNGGFDGNKCFMGEVGSNSVLAMQNGAAAYIPGKHLPTNQLFKLTIWMKAPQFTTSGTDAMYIDVSTGAVKTSTASTNGIIGEEANFAIECKSYLDEQTAWNQFIFTGSYDTNGVFTPGATQITSQWRQYVGYGIITSDTMKPVSEMTASSRPMPTIKFTNAGVYMLDDMSLTPVTYSDGNMAVDGNFAIKSGTKAAFANNTASTVETDSTFYTYLKVSLANGAATTADMAIPLTNGTKYTISYWAKAETDGALMTAKIASSTLATPYTDTKTITTQWRQYSFDYVCSGTTLSKLSFGAEGAGNSFSIADVRVKVYAPVTIPENVFTTFDVTGNAAEGHTLTADVAFNTQSQYSYLLRVYSSVEDGFVPIYEQDITQTKLGTYQVKKADVGKKLMLEVLAYNNNAVYAVKSETDIVLPEMEITPTFTGWDKASGEVSAEVYVVNNSANGENLQMCVFAILLDANEKVLTFEQVGNINVSSGNYTTVYITLDDMASYHPETMRLYAWRGTDAFTSTMEPLIRETVYELE